MSLKGTLHVLFSLRAEGCPRLALELLREELAQQGRQGAVAVATIEQADLVREFRGLRVPIYELQWRRRGFVSLCWRSWQLIRHLRPRGVVCYPLGLHVPVAVAARSLSVPVVVHIGNAPPADDPARIRKLWLSFRLGAPFVTSHAACSDYVRRQCLRAYGLAERKVITVPNGVRLERFLGVRSLRNGSRGQRLVIGMVGSFEVHKDQGVLIDAVRLLANRGVDAELHLVGDGAQRANLEQRAHAAGVADRVLWVGKVLDVPAELARMDVFAYSVRAEEGLGIALVEALAAGLPIVASDVGACREVLEYGRLGKLVPPGDVSAWADAIADAAGAVPAAVEAVSRYDIRETSRAYDRLLGYADVG